MWALSVYTPSPLPFHFLCFMSAIEDMSSALGNMPGGSLASDRDGSSLWNQKLNNGTIRRHPAKGRKLFLSSWVGLASRNLLMVPVTERPIAPPNHAPQWAGLSNMPHLGCQWEPGGSCPMTISSFPCCHSCKMCVLPTSQTQQESSRMWSMDFYPCLAEGKQCHPLPQ